MFCEADVCGWVTQPANTWSNLGFVVVGLWVLHLARKEGRAVAGLLGPIALATGVASTAFHATSTLFGQLADQSVMFLESALFVVLNVARVRAIGARTLIAAYLALALGSIVLLLRFETLGIAIFVAHVITFLGLELVLAFRRPRTTSYRALLGVGVTFVSSYALWWLDRLRILCDPHNHVFTAHGAWHLLGAASFYFWYRHYAQFPSMATIQPCPLPTRLASASPPGGSSPSSRS